MAYTEKVDGPKEPNKLIKHSDMWLEVRKLHPPMTFPQKFVEAPMKAAALERQKTCWQRKLTSEEMKHWSCTIH